MWKFLAMCTLALTIGCNNPPTKTGGGGSDTGVTPDQGGGGGGGPDAGGGGGDTGGGGGTVACPATEPSGSCSTIGLQCEYGDDPRESCRTIAKCTAQGWQETIPDCTPLPTTTCPATRDAASGQPCDTQDAICTYDQGLSCTCTNCSTGGPVSMCSGDPTWHCDVPNTMQGCPAGKPRLGAACTAEGTTCRYSCGGGGARTCTSGVWMTADGGPCPVSTIRAKRDVHYLSKHQVDQIANQLESIRLAHYYYKDPSIQRGQRLGFIIEDQPANSPAVDRDRAMVDLYGYTSMLVADAQARSRQIDDLQKRVEKLEQKLNTCRPASSKSRTKTP